MEQDEERCTHTKGQRLLAGGTGLGMKHRQSESESKISTCKTENTLIKTQIQPFNFFPS